MGHLFPTSVLLSELCDRGHDIALRTLAAGVEIGRDMGFATEAVDPRIEAMPLDDWKASNPTAALRRALDVFAFRAEYEVGDLRNAIIDVSPDVVIVDANCWGAAAVAEASGLPWLSFWAFLPYLRSRGVPPWGPGLRPWPGVVGRARDALLRPRISGVFDKALLAPLNRIRAQVDVPAVGSANEVALRPPLQL